jgi:hypothetical protein
MIFQVPLTADQSNTWSADQTFIDNVNLTFGTGGDADIDYDGTNLVVTPDVVGSGFVSLNGDTQIPVGHHFLVGHTAQIGAWGQDGPTPEVQVIGALSPAASIGIARFSDDASEGARLILARSNHDTVGTFAALDTGDTIGEIQFATADSSGTNFGQSNAEISALADGAQGSNDVPGALVFSTNAGSTTDVTERARITASGNFFIGDTAHANATQGLVVNQGASDDIAFALKSSDVGHAHLNPFGEDLETDDFAVFKKITTTMGGLRIIAMREDDTGSNVLVLNASGGQADTTKTTAARGLIEFDVNEHNGSGTAAVITADGNVFAVRANVSGGTKSRFLVDEDGDIYSVTSAQTFDSYDDSALMRAFQKATSPKDVVKDQWDGFIDYNKQTLIDIGVIGNPYDKDGNLLDGDPMWNLTQHTRVLTGAVTQNRSLMEGLVAAILEAVPDARPAIEKYLGGRSLALQGAK